MASDIVIIPCLSDNYAYLFRDPVTGEAVAVDVPDAGPVLEALKARGWRLGQILLTHHHADHVQGVDELRAATGARVIGAAADAHRLPPLDLAIAPGDDLAIAGGGRVIDVSGHTVGHVAFHFPGLGAAFSGDSLMVLGCGRVFEGTMAMMWESLSRLAALPGTTRIFSGHEYAASNARFALTIEPENPVLKSRSEAIATARGEGRPTVPAPLSLERATNPFLRADSPEIRERLGFDAHAADAEIFAAIRNLKDAF